MLQKMAACGNARNDSHMCKNLHKLIESEGRGILLPITTTPVPIKLSKRGRLLNHATVDYPILLPSSWVDTIFKGGGHFLLGGSSLDNLETFQNSLQRFWTNYQQLDPAVVIRGSPRLAIPYCLHGDEGRGRGKKPIMVLSMQALITSLDMETSNLSGHLIKLEFNSRSCIFLYTVEN